MDAPTLATLQRRFRHSLQELHPPRWLLIPFAIIAISDILVTYYALYHIGGPFFERNAYAVLSMQHFGPLGLLIPYLTGITVCTTLALIHPWRRLAFRILGTLYLTYATFIVANNLKLVIPYLPTLLG